MLHNMNILSIISKIVSNHGLGTTIAVYNDIEQKWYYYCGGYNPKNPSNHIHTHSIQGKCFNYILENQPTYFAGEMPKEEAIATKLESIEESNIDYDFKTIWVK